MAIEDDSTTLVIKQITKEDDGLYNLVAKNDCGEASAKFDVEILGEINFCIIKY